MPFRPCPPDPRTHALEYLYKVKEYRPEVIGSTSVGSINAIALAEGRTPADQLTQLDLVLGIWRGLTRPAQFYTLRQWAADVLQSDSIDLGARSCRRRSFGR